MKDMISRAELFNRIASECHYDTEHPLESYAKLLSVIQEVANGDSKDHDTGESGNKEKLK